MFDAVLTALLVIIAPGLMMWRSLAARGKPAEPRLRRYIRSMLLALALDVALLVDWLRAGRSLAAIGLATRVPAAGLVGLGLAACLLATVPLAIRARPRTATEGETAAKALLPTTRTEFAVFAMFSIIVGCSWEILYRGYLLWILPPHVGLPGAVLIAASAYGVAHGFTTLRLFAGSLISALVFTIAYAATGSLWWLMAIHCGLPLIGAFAAWRTAGGFTPKPAML